MLSLGNIIVYLLEGIAITFSIYLIARKQLKLTESITLALSIAVTFMILDLFSPLIGVSARQGAGFGLGLKQVGGTPNPEAYYGSSGAVIEGMDDPVAIEYYQRWNPPYHKNNMPPPINTTQYYQGAPRTIAMDESQSQPIEFDVPQGMKQPIQNASDFESESQVAEPRRTQVSEVQGISVPQKGELSGYVDENAPGGLFASPILRKLKDNPFNTTVRSYTEIDLPGAYYDKDNIPAIISEIQPEPILYSPLKPDYGFRYKLPRGWDQLEQQNLSKAFNKFKVISPNSQDCRS